MNIVQKRQAEKLMTMYQRTATTHHVYAPPVQINVQQGLWEPGIFQIGDWAKPGRRPPPLFIDRHTDVAVLLPEKSNTQRSDSLSSLLPLASRCASSPMAPKSRKAAPPGPHGIPGSPSMATHTAVNGWILTSVASISRRWRTVGALLSVRFSEGAHEAGAGSGLQPPEAPRELVTAR